MPVTSATTARCHSRVVSVIDSTATRAIAISSTLATQSRISFCGTRSATTPPSRAGSRTPIAPQVETTESWPGPPPIRMTSQTWATTQTPEAKVDSTRATASRR
jgi:hypothetical protein